MNDLLFEVGTEELPARLVEPAARQLAERVRAGLESARLAFLQLQVYATPRRLAVWVKGLATEQAPAGKVVRGPSRTVAFGPDGRPTAAAVGFARAQGVAVESLEVRSLPEGEYVVAVRQEPAQPAETILPRLLADAVAQLSFPRSMRWATQEVRFSRPIRWLVALLGQQVLPVEIAGTRSGRESRGHRLSHPGPVAIPSPELYEAVMESVHVIADPVRRRRQVEEEVTLAASRNGGRALLTPELLHEITHLVEYPVGLCGQFNPDFLQLPHAVLVTTMTTHQRYVPMVDEQGRLMARFVVVSNAPSAPEAVVRAGNEKVLSARLADARFFFEEDRRQPLGDRVAALEGITFQEQLGTMRDKATRVEALTGWLAEVAGVGEPTRSRALRAAQLCKADLATHMVFEFPELQGVMGGEYARRSGEAPEVAQAIAEHYMPRGASDRLPSNPEGALVGLADRLDTLVGFFGIELNPTGSEDPFALRRQCLGAVRITLARGWRWSLQAAVDRAAEGYGKRLPPDRKGLASELREFFHQRLKGVLAEAGLRPDSVEAALREWGDDLVDAAARARALDAVRGETYFQDALVVFQRAYNLARRQAHDGSVVPELLQEPTERQLWAALQTTGANARQAAQAGQLETALQHLAQLRPVVDHFFDEVLVMAEDERLRLNRLSLLRQILALFAEVADFSALVSS